MLGWAWVAAKSHKTPIKNPQSLWHGGRDKEDLKWKNRSKWCQMLTIYHKQTDAQVHPWLWPPTPLSPLSFYCWPWHCTAWGAPLVGWGLLSWLCPLPASCTLHWRAGQSKKQRWPWCWANTAQQQKAQGVCYHHYFLLSTLFWSKTKTMAPYWLLWRKLTLLQTSPVHFS